jgi:hypothetical protein
VKLVGTGAEPAKAASGALMAAAIADAAINEAFIGQSPALGLGPVSPSTDGPDAFGEIRSQSRGGLAIMIRRQASRMAAR